MSHDDTARRLLGRFYTCHEDKVCIDDADDGRGDAETVKAMVRDADTSYGLGWDFAYEAVRDALRHVADTGDDPSDPDTAHDFADGACDVYTADLVRWLASAPHQHVPLCDEAREEYGGEPGSLEDQIRLGQCRAYEYAMQAVADNWPGGEEEEEDDAETVGRQP